MPPDSPQPPKAMSINEEKGRTDLRSNQNEREDVIGARKNELRDLGFSEEFIENFRGETLVGANISVRQRLDNLLMQGFNNQSL